MANLHLPAEMDSQAKLANVISHNVKEFTKYEPMNIADICTAIAFTAGYAIGNQPRGKESKITRKELRHLALNALDKGIKAAEEANGSTKIIMPSDNVNTVGLVKR